MLVPPTPPPPLTPDALPATLQAAPRLLDLLLQAIWLMAQEVYCHPDLAQALHQQAPTLASSLKRASQATARQDQPPAELDGFAVLDAFARFGVVDLSFPYPSSPRLDGVGGARKVAPDGSPGIPAAWLRWMTQPRIYDERRDRVTPHAPLLLAVAWLMRYEPDLWRLYADAVIEGFSTRALTERHQCSAAQIYRRLTRARVLLLTHISYFVGVTTLAEYEHMLDAIARPNSELPAEPASCDLTSHEVTS